MDNLDKQVAEAAKKAEEKKREEEKHSWLEELFMDLVRQAANSIVGAVMDSVGDTIKGTINGNSASRAARKEHGAYLAANSKFDDLSSADQKAWEKLGYTKDDWNYWSSDPKTKEKAASRFPSSTAKGKSASYDEKVKTIGTTDSSKWIPKKGQSESGCEGGKRLVPIKDAAGKDTGSYTCQ